MDYWDRVLNGAVINILIYIALGLSTKEWGWRAILAVSCIGLALTFHRLLIKY